MDERAGVDPRRVDELWRRESERYAREHPRCFRLRERARTSMPHGVPMLWMASYFAHPPVWIDEGRGAHFTCADGRRFLDTNVGDKSTFCGIDPEPVVRAVQQRVAAGAQFMLPTEDAIAVAEELARRWRLPSWQFTLSASQANTEALRLARHATGRYRLLSFTGNYGGHGDEMLTAFAGEGRLSYLGLAPSAGRDLDVIPFNDLDALERALAGGDYACVFTEPALTNEGVVLPDPGFHEALRSLTRDAGTLLVFDETHTLICAPGGLTERWALEPDMVVVGKAIGGGLPLGAYGMTAELAAAFERGESLAGEPGELATGGTLFANALSMAAARAALEEVLTPPAYEHAASLGAELADGLEAVVREAGLPWRVQRLWPRSGITFSDRLARSAAEADADEQPELNAALRLHLANRGVWEAISTAGPAMSVAATRDDVAAYVAAFGEFVADVTGTD
ncbi:MAG: aminotransferase class III-fold pyridoxal phosphate-dependent enzyme [Actinobacteria bacterium]|nr:aminotransferase class III-fold pyridoxal phosphate-dependent enzyme [Actinomycetota bacterium]